MMKTDITYNQSIIFLLWIRSHMQNSTYSMMIQFWIMSMVVRFASCC